MDPCSANTICIEDGQRPTDTNRLKYSLLYTYGGGSIKKYKIAAQTGSNGQK
jgi:hypothetical protein